MTGINRDSSNDCKGIIQSRRELATSSLIADRYACGQKIYRSKNSIVYSGWDTVSGDAVVLKKLPDSSSSERISEFRREGTILKLQTHSGLIHGEGYFLSHKQHWLIMEPAKGDLLLDALASGEAYQWNEKKKRMIVSNLIDALKALHDNGWEHGDIKPDNIFIDSSRWKVTLIDFSATRALGESRLHQTYSKEWSRTGCMPHRSIDNQVDIYGIGLIIWALWTGGPPASLTITSLARSLINTSQRGNLKKKIIEVLWLYLQLQYKKHISLNALRARFGS